MNYIVGIDEVGRGPLAGPVTVGIVMCEENFYKKLKKDRRLPPLGKDSKKLSPESREKYCEVLNYIGVPYVVVHISNKEIDKIGISKCIKKAMGKGLKKILKNTKITFQHSEGCWNVKVLLDGGLKAPIEFKNQKTIIKGDEKEKIIAWASILAKVSRDELMRKASKKYPKYGFEKHKGYGTLFHRVAIKKHGLSDFHRKTFCTTYFSCEQGELEK